MSLTSVNYILFLLASVAVFYLIPGKYRPHLIMVLSIVFYMFFSPEKLLILLAFIFVIYFLGLRIGTRKKAAALLCAAGVTMSAAVLVFFRVLSSVKSGDLTPLGLSYCILQSISYLLAVYRGTLAPVTSPVELFNYLLFFPKLMAGPIEEPGQFLERLRNSGFDCRNILRGLPLIAVGMAKKLAVAEVLTPAVTRVFDDMVLSSGSTTVIGIISYSFVILFDFSGYSDMAMGASLLFGIPLTENFRSPYLAVGMVDFWKRWHISLTSWLRNNIYFPLGGSRTSRKERYLNVLTVFMVSGLWHGTTLNYLVWGIYHGLLQTGELMLCDVCGIDRHKKAPLVLRPFLCLITFILSAIGWVFFRSSSLSDAILILSGIFTPWTSFQDTLSSVGLSVTMLIFAAFSIVLTTIFKAIINRRRDMSLLSSCFISAASIILALLGVIIMGQSEASSFIYFNY